MCPSRWACVEGLQDLRRNLDPLRLDEPLAADADGVPLDLDRDAVTDLVLGVVGRRQGEPQLLGLVEDGQGDRVVELPLGGRREAEDPLGSQPSAAITRPTSGRSRVRVPVLSKRTVSIWFIISERPPVLDQDALARAQGQRAEHRQRSGHADAGPEVAVEHRDRADGPHRGHPERTDAQGREHGLVGQPLALVLRRHLVAGRIAQDLADLGRGRLAPRHLDRDLDLARHQQRRGENPVAGSLFGRRRLAGQGVLVDQRHAARPRARRPGRPRRCGRR